MKKKLLNILCNITNYALRRTTYSILLLVIIYILVIKSYEHSYNGLKVILYSVLLSLVFIAIDYRKREDRKSMDDSSKVTQYRVSTTFNLYTHFRYLSIHGDKKTIGALVRHVIQKHTL